MFKLQKLLELSLFSRNKSCQIKKLHTVIKCLNSDTQDSSYPPTLLGDSDFEILFVWGNVGGHFSLRDKKS